MTPRAGRPTHLKPMANHRMPSVMAYQAESTPGLTPRTPYSFQPAEITVQDEDEEDMEIKIHHSPSAPITPAARDARRYNKPRADRRRWRLVTWSAVVTLVVIVLLSLYNVDPRHILLPQARSDSLTDWIGGVSDSAGTFEVAHETSTAGLMHPTRATTSDGPRITMR